MYENMEHLTITTYYILSLGLYLIVMKSGLILCKKQMFTVAFMTNIGYADTCSELSLFFAANETTTCLVSAPRDSFEKEVYINDASHVLEVKLPRSLALSNSGIEQKGIQANCNTPVTLYGINPCLYNTDGFFVIPNDQLGRKYYAFTVVPTSSKSQVAVVSYLDNTTVVVHLHCTGCNVVFNNIVYISGSIISIVLDAYECFQIQSDGNLAGVYISSTNPVSVFSGNIRTSMNGGSGQEHLILHLPPIQAWGKQFVVVPTPYATSAATISDSLFIVASTNYTDCSIICTGTDATEEHHYVVNAGQIIQRDINLDNYCSIETNGTVLAVQAISPNNRPSLILLTPIDRYYTNYSFMTPKASTSIGFTNYFIYVIEELAVSDLMLDSVGIELKEQNSKRIPGTNLIGGYFGVTDNSHQVSHPYAHFNGAIFGFALYESYAVSLGWNWKGSTISSTSNPSVLTTDQTFQDTTYEIQTTVQASKNTFTTGTSTASTMTVQASQGLSDCQCPFSSLSTKLQEFLRGNVTKEEFVRLVLTDFEQNIKPSIMVDRTKLSQTKRKKISVMNIDATAHHIGWGFSWIVVIPIALAVFSDILNLWRFCARRIKQNN